MKTASSIPSRFRTALITVTAGGALLLGACASQGDFPTANLAVARTSVSQAEAVNASQLAPVEYQSARDKLSRAEEAARSKRYNDARGLADEAAADADLAQRKSQAAKSASAAQDLQRSNAVLNSEINRSTTTTTVTPTATGDVTRRSQTTTTVITQPATSQ